MESPMTKTMQDVEATTLKAWMEQGEAILIDVREPPEHATEHIPGARLLPLSTFDPARVSQEAGKKVVLHCVMGMRSAQAGQKLLDAGLTTVYNFRGGIQAWKDAGYATAHGQQRTPMSLERQGQMVSGSLVLLGTVLGVVASPWFLLLSGVVGAGLVYAGVSGTCVTTRLLAQLPYNQRG
jgi:rhodanese-related sulfurtransferase